jgi:LacI family transcriptional regulator, repressor for deo operon, udp, cdd, tsx, nupC, and nupG
VSPPSGESSGTADRPRRSPRGGSAPTIYDVARESGVAASTVSRAFSRPGRVNAETAARVRAAAERIGYRTNPLARALPSGRTRMIALVVGDVTNPVNFEIIRGGQGAANAAGYIVVLADTQESVALERQAVERTVPMVEGLVLSSSRMSDSAIRMASKQRPVVVVNRGFPDVPCIVTDNARGMRRAVEHLAELGHNSLTYVAGPEASWADGMRWRAAREACYELDLRIHRLGPYPPTIAGGMSAVEDLRRAPTTAVLGYNDMLAIGVLRGLRHLGVQVPRDVSVVGFDNIFGSDFGTPALTTVAAPLRALGTAAVEHLLAQLHGSPPRTGQPMTLPAKLVVRESTGERSRRRSPAWGARKNGTGSAVSPTSSRSADADNG